MVLLKSSSTFGIGIHTYSLKSGVVPVGCPLSYVIGLSTITIPLFMSSTVMLFHCSYGIISFTLPSFPGKLCVVPVANITGANPAGIVICTSLSGSGFIVVFSVASPFSSTGPVGSGGVDGLSPFPPSR